MVCCYKLYKNWPDLVRTQRRAQSRLLAMTGGVGWVRQDLRDEVILGLASVSQGECLPGGGGGHSREATAAWHMQREQTLGIKEGCR